MPRFQYMGCGNYVKIFKIEDNTYKATVSRDIWDSTSITKISQNMCYYIRNKKAGKNPTFKYGTIQNITSSPEVNKCDICDYDKCKAALHVHHIDHDRTNGKLSNLQIVCLNCHAECHHLENK